MIQPIACGDEAVHVSARIPGKYDGEPPQCFEEFLALWKRDPDSPLLSIEPTDPLSIYPSYRRGGDGFGGWTPEVYYRKREIAVRRWRENERLKRINQMRRIDAQYEAARIEENRKAEQRRRKRRAAERKLERLAAEKAGRELPPEDDESDEDDESYDLSAEDSSSVFASTDRDSEDDQPPLSALM